jgi:hypothetical protein
MKLKKVNYINIALAAIMLPFILTGFALWWPYRFLRMGWEIAEIFDDWIQDWGAKQ